MNEINEIYITLVSMVFLLTLSLLILPSGQLSKFMKMIFSIFLFFCLLLPIINFINKGVVESFNESNQIEIDYSFTQNIEKYNLSITAKQLQNIVKNEQNCEIEVDFSTKTINNEIKADKVFIKIIQVVLNSEDEHIHLIDRLKNLGSVYFSIKEDQVIVSENI